MIKKGIIRILEFIPLSTFLILQRVCDDRWREIFLICAFLAVAVLVYFHIIHRILNRLNLGINYYLIVACLVNLSGFKPLNDFIQNIRGMGLIISIIITGIITFFFSKYRFIPLDTSDDTIVIKRSLYLLLATILCGVFMLAGNYIFHFHIVFIEIIPFVVLFTFQGILMKKPR
ncbi:MAG: hypothetical protein A2015_17495 [Spirochaetes bacterium GWF1_31_7]|nr:MAG: hypothetical protein A2Y30_05485 [Spirochaetes bacterium GWE1_32_154]OHD46248.1 MAG: hypothetical protein A2Y29_08490 [Spirochaetes bacterium GWE2_31_10]OHD48618.1 MAG: hypothetical protein A2015_17495 [Spirochaetes bacterium GWF1_31_7]OHD74412.1 MAG: hypothetical protein A2355_03080 [Spirochaetes bacterium RIFOXYB1_FULL_32_8]HBD93064.1 hypothetical protein [Spirochaetia bacterium]